MTKNYDAASAAHRRLRPQVKRAITQHHYGRAISLCAEAYDAFDAAGVSVDDWAFYLRSAEDAYSAARRGDIFTDQQLAAMGAVVADLRVR